MSNLNRSFLVLIFSLAIGISSSAQAQTDISGETQVPLPSAFGDPGSVRAIPSLGVVTDTIPIEASPGRRGVRPRLALSYNSATGLGLAGLGWSVSIGHVEKWSGDGTPIIGNPDRYSYALAGAGGELINVGDGAYRSRLESVYREFRRTEDGKGWEMRNGEGIIHRFGGTEPSRIEGNLWLLDQVRDASGNSITYLYEEIDGVHYPKTIHYTGYVPTGDLGANRIEFAYEANQNVRTSFQAGTLSIKARRLQSISVYAGNLLTRRYELFYEASPLNNLALLTRVDLVGSDDTSRVTLRTLAYGTRALDWSGGPSTGTLPVYLVDEEGKETGARVIDVNGDTFADAIDNGENVYLGDGTGSFIRSATWSDSLVAADIKFTEEGIDTGVRMVDANGDARVDLIVATPSRLEVLLNTGMGWVSDPTWSASLQGLSGAAQAVTVDCTPRHCDDLPEPQPGCTPAHCSDDDGDEEEPEGILKERRGLLNPEGLETLIRPEEEGDDEETDDCVPVHCSEDPDVPGCLPDHCSDDVPADQLIPTEEDFSIVTEDGRSKGVEFADVNADGRIDIVWSLKRTEEFLFEDAPVRLREVFLNQGNGWERHGGLSTALVNIPSEFVIEGQPQAYSMSDVNGDGFADIMRAIGEGDHGQEIFLGTGSGWTLDEDFTNSLSTNGILAIDDEQTGQGLMPVDFNDDGLPDFLRANQTVTEAFVNTGVGWQPDPAMAAVLANESLAFATSEGKSNGTVLADIDGDGIADVVVSRPDEQRFLLSGTLRDSLLVQVTEALGGVSTISWAPSSSFDNRREDGVEGLPVTMPVITQLHRNNGRGRTLGSSFIYKGGLFTDRQLRGFKQSLVTPSSGLTFRSSYEQGEELAGQSTKVEAFDSGGLLRMLSTSGFEIVASTGGVTQIRPDQNDESYFDAGGSRHSRVLRTFDDRLHKLTVTSDPDIEVPGDETVTRFTWVRNDEAGIWSLPEQIQVQDLTGHILSDSIILYDNLPQGQATKGLPTQTRDLAEPGVWVAKHLEYNQYGNIVQVEDRAGGVSQFTYGEETATYRTSATDPEGRITHSEYDPRFGTLVRDVDPAGNEKITAYDAFGRITWSQLPGDEASPFKTQTYSYSPIGDPENQYYHIIQTETAGLADTQQTRSYFDASALIYKAEQYGMDGRKVSVLVHFDNNGNTVAASAPFFEGETPVFTQTERDPLGRPTKVTDIDGTFTTMTYQGDEVFFTNKLGVESSLLLNGNGDVKQIHEWLDGAEQITRYDYDAAGRLNRIVDALGSETKIFYDQLGRRARFEDPNAGNYAYRYDGEGRVLEQIDPDGNSTHYHYNLAGDLLRKQFPDGTEDTFEYGVAGDGNGVGKLVRVHDAAGDLAIGYDARGNIAERRRTIDGRTYVTGYAFDSMDRVRGISYPDGFVVNYTYAPDGTVSRVTDGNGRDLVTDITRNAEGQIQEIGYGNGVRSSYAYDLLARMTSIRTATARGEALQSFDYQFDANDNVVEIADSIRGAGQSFVYDALDRISRATGPYGVESYAYDAIGNLLSKGDRSFTIDPAHPQRIICSTVAGAQDFASGPGGVNTGIVASPELLSAEQHPAGSTACGDSHPAGGNAAGILLAYDARGNVIRKGDRALEYDSENHMTGIRDKNGHFDAENVYDASGQRVILKGRTETRIFIDGIYEEGQTHVSRHIRSGPLLVATIVAPKATVKLVNQGDSAAISPVSPDPGWLARRAVGLSLLLSAFVLVWVQRWLIRLNWRVGLNALQSIGATLQLRPVKGAVVFSLLVGQFVLTNHQPLAMTRPSLQTPSAKIYYYHSNHLGSINVVTNDKGQVVERRDYRPYGERFDWTGAVEGPREMLQTFGGHRYDDVSDLYYMGARHYDPELGRFLSADNQVTDPTAPKTLHRYAFAANNPIRYTDPDGRSFWSWISGVANDIGEFFSENKDIFLIIGAAVLVVVLVAITVATAGTTAGLLVAGLALLGAAVFAGIAISQGHSPNSVEFWKITLTGALLGAAIGAGLVALPAAMASSSTLAVSVGQWALVGAATGAVEETIVHFVTGGSVDNLLGGLISSVAIGLVIGAVTGGIAGRAAASVKHAKLVRSLEKLRGVRGWVPRLAATIRIKVGTAKIWLLQPGKLGIRIKLTYAAVASWALPGQHTLSGDFLGAFAGAVVFLGQRGIQEGRMRINEMLP